MPITAFRNGYIARFPSMTSRSSFRAVMRREKLIHIGITKIRMTPCLSLSFPVARM